MHGQQNIKYNKQSCQLTSNRAPQGCYVWCGQGRGGNVVEQGSVLVMHVCKCTSTRRVDAGTRICLHSMSLHCNYEHALKEQLKTPTK
jgi:hypothetical protein